MQIQLVGSKQGRAHLRDVQSSLEFAGIEARIIDADAYSAAGLLEIVEVQVARGDRHLLVSNCSSAQVYAVLEWQSCDDDELLKDLEIHLVRKG
ncbi:hypothetical protein [Pseudomonas asplenii]|uniref:hypothetical protein n=1 Tax=Pseudomonas asplenii TaxID=53407 RepID=UPI0023602FA4|nr:hypothetical protein [Pseudomonas asplenii]